MQHSNNYTIMFAATVCLVCAVFVSSSAVGLKERQEYNKVLDKQKKVLSVAGLMPEGAKWPAEKILSVYKKSIRPAIVDLKSGQYNSAVDAETFDIKKATRDPKTSRSAPRNDAKVLRIPNQTLIYQVLADGSAAKVEQVVLPIHTKGLWSTLYGFIAMASDGQTIRGLTFYQHAETPGLGGEVDNPKWKALWKGRKVYDASGAAAISVIKGVAGSVLEDPYHVDGLSGATLTSRGVDAGLKFWLGEVGFQPFLQNMQRGAL